MPIDKDKLEAVANFLKDRFMDEMVRHYKETGKRLSQADMAAEWGVDPTGLSNWINAKRAMSVENVIQVSRFVGPKIFEVNGLPRMMPDDPQFQELADLWPKLDDATRYKVIEALYKLANK